MRVTGMPEDKHFDWKEGLLASKECGQEYECVYCYKTKYVGTDEHAKFIKHSQSGIMTPALESITGIMEKKVRNVMNDLAWLAQGKTAEKAIMFCGEKIDLVDRIKKKQEDQLYYEGYRKAMLDCFEYFTAKGFIELENKLSKI